MTAEPSLPPHPALATGLVNELAAGDMQLAGRLVQASNATFLATVTVGDRMIECVYKPIRGERPLWDFPTGTLGLREVAAYEVSRIAGFDVVPVTALAEGPLGLGSVQAWVQADEVETACLVDLVSSSRLPLAGWFDVVDGLDRTDQEVSVVHADDTQLRRLAVFDVVINNADRKGGHILGSGGRVFGVDHGISFHTDPKLRTLLWGWAGAELTTEELAAVRRVHDDVPAQLGELLAEVEVEALVRRAERLLERKRFPKPRGHGPAIPWPPF